MIVLGDCLYQVLTSEKVVYILVNQICLSKLHFKLRANKESSNEHCGGHLLFHVYQAL